MKILLAFNEHRHGGGSDRVAHLTASLLRSVGVEVEVFQRSSRDLIGWSGSVRAFTSGLYSPSAVQAFRAVLNRFKPDILHAHELYPLITPWILPLAKRAGTRVLLHCHDYRISCPVATHFQNGRVCIECAGGHEWRCVRHGCAGDAGKSIGYALRNALARHKQWYGRDVDHFITPSQAARQMLIEHGGLPEDRIHVIPNPVEDAYFLDAPWEDGGYLAYAGRFEVEKGFETLLEALDGTEWTLRVAGAASDAVRHACARLSPRVDFLGPLNPPELARFFHHARMVVCPGLAEETFGLVAAEALATGTPVVLSDRGALREVVGPGGVTFPAGDFLALRAGIRALWDDPERRKSLALAGRAHVQSFREERYLERVLKLYESVVDSTYD